MTTVEAFRRLRERWAALEEVMDRDDATRALWAGLKIALPWVGIAVGVVLVFG